MLPDWGLKPTDHRAFLSSPFLPGVSWIIVKQIGTADLFLPSTVRVGDLAKRELLRTLREHEVHLNQAAEDLFMDCRFSPCKQAETIRIAALSVYGLGFRSGATYGQLTARALELGFVECPLELGPYLRLQFLNQPEAPVAPSSTSPGSPSGAITIASPSLDKTDETPKGFYLRHVDSQLWLRGYWADAEHVWSQEDVLIFALDEGRPGERARSDHTSPGG